MRGTRIYAVLFNQGELIQADQVKNREELKAVSEEMKKKNCNALKITGECKTIKRAEDLTTEFLNGLVFMTSRAINIVVEEIKNRERAKQERIELYRELKRAEIIIIKRPRKNEWTEIYTIREKEMRRIDSYRDYIRDLYYEPRIIYPIITDNEEEMKELLHKTYII